TDFPKFESSGLKGCIREAFEKYEKLIVISKDGKDVECTKKLREKFPELSEPSKFKEAISIIFGPEGGESHAGAISITDARILLFPVKSLKGVFAWITCPLVLERFKRDLEFVGIKNSTFSKFSNFPENTIPYDSKIEIKTQNGTSSKIVLEEFTFEVENSQHTTEIAQKLSDIIFPNDPSYAFWKEKLKRDLVILSDDDFKHFVKSSTEVITRTKIDNDTGTVQTGALWTEEYLPQDTIMYSIVMFTQPRVKDNDKKGIFKRNNTDEEVISIVDFFTIGIPEVIQVGGNQTIGKGLMRVNFLNKEISHGK
ncbi:MAG: type III-B CRISPR module RAMP protein Cmr4, partial [Candidatus Hydrothermales bacterium]